MKMLSKRPEYAYNLEIYSEYGDFTFRCDNWEILEDTLIMYADTEEKETIGFVDKVYAYYANKER